MIMGHHANRRASRPEPHGGLWRFSHCLSLLSGLALTCLPLAGKAAANPQTPKPANEGVPTVYYVDGYHGGVRGHMPAGAWRDILNRLRSFPAWKVSLDIEPASWEVLRRRDPAVFAAFARLLADHSPAARVEIVGGSYSQPDFWVLGGESLIRQFQFGLRTLHQTLPGVRVDTYATQEPCFTSQLPQLLRSLGYKRAVMKNNTAFYGYMTGRDADTLDWVGPDGSSIPAVPHYACERPVSIFTTDSTSVPPDYARRCVEHGISRPSGMQLQDLGWAAKPRLAEDYVRYVTWREYFETVAPPARQPWRVTQEDIHGTLPWGETQLNRLAQDVRSLEVRLPFAEKMATMAGLLSGRPYPGRRLDEAWKHLLDSEHHDDWVVAAGRGRRNGAWQVGAQTYVAHQILDGVIAQSTDAMTGVGQAANSPEAGRWVRVFNTQPFARDDLAALEVTGDLGTRGFRVFDDKGREVVTQLDSTRAYLTQRLVAQMLREGRVHPTSAMLQTLAASGDAGINAGVLLFRARVPAMGYSTYHLEPISNNAPTMPSHDALRVLQNGHPLTVSGGTDWMESRQAPRVSPHLTSDPLVIESGLYRIKLDPKRGGAITSLYDKELRQEFCDPHSELLFNEYLGYFIKLKQWCSSSQHPARIQVLEAGPVRATIIAHGQIGDRFFISRLQVTQGQRRIDCQVTFRFGGKTWIGDPWNWGHVDWNQRRRSFHDGRWKLQAVFPFAAAHTTIFKDAAFDVCQSHYANTFYQRWDRVKHDILLDWVDALDQKAGRGVCVFSDHTTAYTHGSGPAHPLGLVLGWGWKSPAPHGWDNCPLTGDQTSQYAWLPHAGRWDNAHLWRECQRWHEPLIARLLSSTAAGGPMRASLLRVEDAGMDVPTMMLDGNDLLVRLFNAEGDASPKRLSLALKPRHAELIELDGRIREPLKVHPSVDGRYETEVAMPQFGLRTVRFIGVVKSRPGSAQTAKSFN